MDETVSKPKPKRQTQVRLEVLDANTVRKISREAGIAVPYLLREAVQLLQAKYTVRVSGGKAKLNIDNVRLTMEEIPDDGSGG